LQYELSKLGSELPQHPALIINDILTEKYFVFMVYKNSQKILTSIGSVRYNNNQRVFFLYFATGKDLANSIPYVVEYVKETLCCQSIEFVSRNKILDRFYEMAFRKYKKKQSTFFNIII
jgi:hypothetical protein